MVGTTEYTSGTGDGAIWRYTMMVDSWAPPKLTKLWLTNFRSYSQAEVAFGSVTFLVGPNGAGKSNLLDALRFLSGVPRHAMRDLLTGTGTNGWMRSIAKRDEDSFLLGIECLDDARTFTYSCRVFPNAEIVIQESASVRQGNDSRSLFSRHGLETKISEPSVVPNVEPDELLLPSLAGTADLRPLTNILRSIRIFDINPNSIRNRIEHDSGKDLASDGSNSASVIMRMAEESPTSWKAVKELLKTATPSIQDIRLEEGPLSVITFDIVGLRRPRFHIDISDGTLSLLGVLLALFSTPTGGIVVIEEPERSLHPNAIAVLQDALQICGLSKQVVVTTQSTDLLDAKWIDAENLRLVEWTSEGSEVRELPSGAREVIQRHLRTPGQLMRAGALSEAGPT